MTEVQWNDLQSRLPVGSPVLGTVVRREVFGLFVNLDPLIGLEHTALLEVIAFRSAFKGRMHFPEDYPNIEERIEARIAYYSSDIGKIRLTQLENDPFMGR